MHKKLRMNIAYTFEEKIILNTNTYDSIYTQYQNDQEYDILCVR